MANKKLIDYLEQNHVHYESRHHDDSSTALETARKAHVPSHELAKTVLVNVDGELAMAVLPADERLDLEKVRQTARARRVTLASESAFEERFDDCEVGAMSPFGNLYGMDVYASDHLAEDEQIAFSGGTHHEVIQLAYRDFERLVHPTIVAS